MSVFLDPGEKKNKKVSTSGERSNIVLSHILSRFKGKFKGKFYESGLKMWLMFFIFHFMDWI